MPNDDFKYICKGCNEGYMTKGYAELKVCSKCEVETCIECGRMYHGKVYCPDCKPIETNYYDRSVE